jgi:transposase InsO family protein
MSEDDVLFGYRLRVLWSQADRERAAQAALGRDRRLPQRRLALLCRHGLNTHSKRLSLIDRDRVHSSLAWAELVTCPRGNPTGAQTSTLARRLAADLAAAGWRLERVLTDNGGEFRAQPFATRSPQLGARHTLIRAGRPQTNGAAEALHRLILKECRRPAFARYLHVRFTGLKRDLERYVDDYNLERIHHGRRTRRRVPSKIVYGARKAKAR